ncbi:MAG TPA: F0F1 ATP synthase subunit B [Thermoleophilia bacterium]|nr:F0F1 ATP synthase subunit B [Thermoleophilia bacterium]
MLSINPGLMVWTLICFSVSVLILWKFAFGPLQRLLDERRGRIQASLDTAEETRAEALRLLEEYKQTLTKVRGEAEEILERARASGETTKVEILAEAKAQADRRLEQARQQIERDTRAALQDIKAQVADLALLAAEKVTAKSLTDDDHRRLVEDALKDVDLSGVGTRNAR